MLGWLLMTLLGGSYHVDSSGVSEVPASAVQFAGQPAYDATEARNRRRDVTVRTQSEDRILEPSKRAKLQANAQDLHRNFAIAQWMIRRHLDYVATFQFHGRNEDDTLNDRLEFLMRHWSRAPNCDVAGRHRLAKMIRLTELLAVLHGDCGLMKVRSGQLQGIESDRVRNPIGMAIGDEWVHGVKKNPAGRALAYAVHRRLPYGGFEFEREVGAQNLCLHGYFDRFDQLRGISPLASALNPLRDVYENFDYALIKAKVEQLFALAIFRKGSEDTGGADNVTATETTGADGQTRRKYEVDFGLGPIKLELEPGDDAKFLESQHPSANFQQFTQLVLMVGLKALDIPYSFYDEKHTNFFGSRGAWLHYERACEDKRESLQELMHRLTLWRLMLWIMDGDLVLPRGMSIGDLAWEWVPMGMPWWDPAKEIRGEVMAISGGLDNPQRITKERGRGDFYDNVRQTIRAIKFTQEQAEKEQVNFRLSFDPGDAPVEVEANAE
jgi:capsid protein